MYITVLYSDWRHSPAWQLLKPGSCCSADSQSYLAVSVMTECWLHLRGLSKVYNLKSETTQTIARLGRKTSAED